MPEHAELVPKRHGEIKTIDHNGYSVYVCADCGQNVNAPGCGPALLHAQPNPPTFDSLLNDPTQQLDTDGVVLMSVLDPHYRPAQPGPTS